MAVFITTPRVVWALNYMKFGGAESLNKKSVSCIKIEAQEQRIALYGGKCK